MLPIINILYLLSICCVMFKNITLYRVLRKDVCYMIDLLEETNDMGSIVIEKNKVYPIRVVLIAEYGEMLTLLLPDNLEGRYQFVDTFGLKRFPVFFESENGKWVVNLEKTAYFFKSSQNGEINLGQKHDMVINTMFSFKFKGKRYTLYAETEYPGDHTFLSYYIEERTDYLIGRSNKCDICYQNIAVSREHACLKWNGSQWDIVDLNSTNGTYLNGKRIDKATLNTGDVVFIVGLYVIVGSGFISINNFNNRALFNTPKIRRISSRNDLCYSNPLSKCDYALFERAPRKMMNIVPKSIDIEMPPMSLKGNNIPLLLRLGSPMLMGGQALMTGNILMAMTSMVLPTLTQGFTEKERREYETKRLESYRKYLEHTKIIIDNEKSQEEQQLNFNYPNLNNTLKLALTKKRLWDRRKNDSDFLKIRIGHGDFPLLAEIKCPPKRFQVESDALEDEMYELAEKPVLLNNAPVVYSFIDDYITGIVGNKQAVMEMMKHIILQIVSTHSYDEVKIILIAEATDAKALNFVRYLPHNWSNDKSVRFFVTNQEEVQQLSNYLNKEQEEKSEKYGITDGVSYVVFALNKTLFNYAAPVSNVLSESEYKGMSLVVSFDVLPKECGKVIYLKDQSYIVDYFHPENGNQLFCLDNVDKKLVEISVKSISETKINTENAGYMLPNMVTFLEMYNVGKIEHLNPTERWKNNNPIKSLAAPIGVGVDGKLFSLDLHEKFQGPHGLVAGMTGSGKSEFLITYILSMAVNYSPDEVAFVLIDYKGGGLADAFEDKSRGIHLPHLVGTITNLDGSSIQRSLMSIKSELKRRQTVFKEAKSKTNEGTMDIYDYQKLYRNNKVSTPVPHLIIISDEFAEMKAQQPEFMDELISTARIGRSLGVHLILATQKPSGVVNDQIRSNTKFQVCLRVQDRSDSMDMINRPDAAELKNTGRFYLQVGYNELFAQGQSAWCGAEYIPSEEIEIAKDESIQFVDNVGQTIINVKKETKKVKTGTKQIVSIVKYLSDLAKRKKIEPKSLWLNPLPNFLDYDELVDKFGSHQQTYMSAFLGMVDDPEMQNQFPLIIDFMNLHHMLIYGGVANGKSTFVRTLLLNFVEHYSPEKFNYYILDLSAGALRPFSKLPHCGAYLTDANEGDFNRMFALIQDIIDERKKVFVEADVTNYNSYCKIASMSMILVIIDGYSNIRNYTVGNDLFSMLQDKLNEAANYGVKYIVTANRPNDLNMKSRDEFDYKIALNAKDCYDYNDMLDTKCSFMPPQIPGRGLCIIDERVLSYHVAMPYCNKEEQERSILLKERLKGITCLYQNNGSVKKLPMLDKEQEYSDFCKYFDKNSLPLGYLVSSTKPVAMPFHQLYSLSLYFGNPNGVKSVLDNLIYACKYNEMDLIIIRKNVDTIFGGKYESDIKSNTSFNTVILDCDYEGLKVFSRTIFEEIKARNIFRDEYCDQHKIPNTDKTRVKQAEKYIRSNTRPLMVIFESFSDVCNAEKDDNLVLELSTYFSKIKGYNIYFTACFYPSDDGSLSINPVAKCFNKEENYLLFGGQYGKQNVFDLPMDYRRIEQINPNYNRYIFKYRGQWYAMHMPCGQINNDVLDEEDMSII